MDISLRPDNEKFIEEVVRDGEFSDRTAALDRAVDVLRRQREQLIREVNKGIEQAERGEGRTFENSDELRQYFTELTQKHRDRQAPKKSG